MDKATKGELDGLKLEMAEVQRRIAFDQKYYLRLWNKALALGATMKELADAQ